MARGRRRGSDWDRVRGVAFGFLGLVLVALLAGGGYWLSRTQVKLDAVTNCPVTGPSAIHAILIDRSDPISPQHALQVRQIVDGYIARAKTGERFDLYVASGDAINVLAPVASVCSPGRGDQANELYQNPQMIQRQFEEKFVSVLRDNLDRLLSASTTKSSPILESIRAAAVSSFGAVEPGQLPLQMTVVSDFIQNSALNTHFANEISFDDLGRKPAWRMLQANLKGATVNALYLTRAEKRPNGRPIQDRGHQLFWEKAIDASGGQIKVTVL
jgi:hypothetical protein